MVPYKLILASTSPTRRLLLERAGVIVEFRKPDLDEAKLQHDLRSEHPKSLASKLAAAKALSLSKASSSDIMIGADQTLDLDGKTIHKSTSLAQARETLRALRGKTHHLHSAIACAQSGKVIFEDTSSPALTMRSFSDEELEEYLNMTGEDILGSVGCYHFESLGIQLFEKAEGDFHAILGLPLLPLLAFLRQHAMLKP